MSQIQVKIEINLTEKRRENERKKKRMTEEIEICSQMHAVTKMAKILQNRHIRLADFDLTNLT